MSTWIQITSGRGPAECCWVVAQLLSILMAEARAAGCHLDIVEEIPGEMSGTCQSVLLSLQNDEIPQWIKSWLGTIQWIGESPFRANHKRKNWFVGVHVMAQPQSIVFSTNDIRFDTFRASGPGGQNVNKVESAVRATHLPSGISVSAQEARSQRDNRLLAVERLRRRLQTEADSLHLKARSRLRYQHDNLERGNPVRVYSGNQFKKL
jgi:peptide chain release factor